MYLFSPCTVPCQCDPFMIADLRPENVLLSNEQAATLKRKCLTKLVGRILSEQFYLIQLPEYVCMVGYKNS